MKYEIIKGTEKDFEGAPEWATMAVMFDGSGGRGIDFSDGMSEGARVFYSHSKKETEIVFPRNWEIIAERRPITEPVWNGEGLPPVGVECEGLFPRHPGNSFEWQDCLVLYAFEHECAVKSKVTSTLHYCDQFRPARSPEDVARDEAIEEMRDVGYTLPAAIRFTKEEMAALYDAGYRKME